MQHTMININFTSSMININFTSSRCQWELCFDVVYSLTTLHGLHQRSPSTFPLSINLPALHQPPC
jgi:hypothetical protein